MKKGLITVLAVALLWSLLVVGAQAAQLVVAASGEATTLDPQKTFNGYSFLVTNQIFQTLVIKNDEGFQPKLAKEWEMINETTWRFKLQEGVTYHNGDKFNAESVQYSIKRLIDPATQATGAFVLSAVKDVVVVDEYTVDIITKQPFAPLLAHLTHPVTAIVNQSAVEQYGEDVGQHPIGTGPFVLSSWNTGNDITLSANKDYWRGAPQIDTLVIRVIPEVSTQVVELQSGTVDMMFHIPPERFASLERSRNLEVFKTLGWGSTFVGFNTESGPTSDPRVRQAIAYAIDRDSIVNQLRQGMAVEASAPVPPTVWGSAEGLASYPFDQAKAKQLLAEAGYPNGFEIELLAYQNDELNQLGQAMQFLLDQIGIKVTFQTMDYGAYVGRTTQGDYGMFLSGWGTVTLDADYTLYALLHSSEIPENNSTMYRNKEVDRLLELGRSTSDMAKRQAAYQTVQEIVNEELPLFTVYYPLFSYAKNSRVQGESLLYSWINLDVSKALIK